MPEEGRSISIPLLRLELPRPLLAAGKESRSSCSCFKGGAEEREHGPAPGTEHTAPGCSAAQGEGIFKTNV